MYMYMLLYGLPKETSSYFLKQISTHAAFFLGVVLEMLGVVLVLLELNLMVLVRTLCKLFWTSEGRFARSL